MYVYGRLIGWNPAMHQNRFITTTMYKKGHPFEG